MKTDLIKLNIAYTVAMRKLGHLYNERFKVPNGEAKQKTIDNLVKQHKAWQARAYKIKLAMEALVEKSFK